MDAGLSLLRAFAIFRAFQNAKRPLGVSDLMGALDCPKSSLNLILKGLVSLGFLNHDARHRTYFPSLSFQHLGDWILDSLTQGANVREIARGLRNAVEETVLVSAKVDTFLEVTIVESSSKVIALQVSEGTRLDLWSSAVGCGFLMSQTDAEIKRLYKSGKTTMNDRPALDDVMRRVKKARANGYALSFGAVIPDVGAIARPLPISGGHHPLVLSVGGPVNRIKKNWQSVADELLKATHAYQKSPEIE